MNLYQIEQDLQELINTLEEQGGEFTDEQLAQLECTQEDFKNKIQSYYYCVKALSSDTAQCKDEEKRIKDIRKSKENEVEKLKAIILDAVTKFGDIQKNGVRCIEYPTFKLSTRKSISVEVDELRIATFIKILRNYIDELDVMCSLDRPEEIDIEGMIGAINAIYKAEYNHDPNNDPALFVPFTVEDFNLLHVKFESNFPLYFLFKEKEYRYIIKALADNPNTWLTNDTSKDVIKNALEQGQVITYANKVGNLSLQMK